MTRPVCSFLDKGTTMCLRLTMAPWQDHCVASLIKRLPCASDWLWLDDCVAGWGSAQATDAPSEERGIPTQAVWGWCVEELSCWNTPQTLGCWLQQTTSMVDDLSECLLHYATMTMTRCALVCQLPLDSLAVLLQAAEQNKRENVDWADKGSRRFEHISEEKLLKKSVFTLLKCL